jgi:hypothetical protein
MIPGSPTVSQLQNFLRAQQGVVEAVRTSSDQVLLTVGERVQATVTSQLPNGRFSVLVKDQLLDMNLPRNTQPGEQLELTVASKDPRLTFILSPQTAARPAEQQAVALSQAGQKLADLLQGKSLPNATVQQSAPLFEGDPQPAQLASQLANRLSESGLFYESHQAQWVQGQRSLHVLMREPQAQQPVQPQTANVAEDVAQSSAKTSLANLAGSEKSSLPQAEVAGVTSRLVQQQLAVLEDKPIIWLGQAWPGQPLRWETELENERDPSSPQIEQAQVWQTRLDLDLPRLGELGVNATLRQGQFQLRFEAIKPETRALLQQNLALLSSHFSAAGLNLASAQIDEGGHEKN